MIEAAGPAYGAFIRAIQELIKRPVGYFLQDRAVNTLVVYAIIKGIVLLGGLFVVAVTREYRVISVSFPWVLTNWDGGWYTGIASNWYAYNYPYSAAFPPLYPLLIKALSFNQPKAISWAALLLSNAFSFVALYFLYKLAPMIVDQKYRLRICFAYMVFPVLIICNLVAYSEALFLATTIGAYYFWKRSKFGFAALLAVCSIFTRQVGAFILIIFVVDMVYGYSVRRNKSQAIQQLAVIAGTCLGVGALYLFYYVTFGDPFIVTRVEAANWQNSIALTHVVTNLKLSLIGIDTQSLYAPGPIPFPLIVISSAVLAATTFCMLRRDAALAVYSAASVLLFLLMSEAQKVPQSFLRFVAATFPIYLFFGLMLSNNWRKNVAVGVIAVLIAIENMYIWMSGAWLY